MSTAHRYASDVAFTPAVKTAQARLGSRRGYARMEESTGWRTKSLSENILLSMNVL